MNWPWTQEDHESVERRLDEQEEKARDMAVRLRRIELELGIVKPEIMDPPDEEEPLCGLS